MMEKIKTSCRAFLRGFLGLYLISQCVLGVCYWFGNVTRAQQFDSVSVMGRWVSTLPVLPVHVVQTAAVFGGLFYFLGRFFHGWRRVFSSLAALTIPFVMQVCLSETEHGAALTAVLCMAGVIMDCHQHRHLADWLQRGLFGACAWILLLCGASYSCAAGFLFFMMVAVCMKAAEKREKVRALILLATLFLSVGYAYVGVRVQNELNPDRMQITWESALMKRFAYPGLNENLMEGLPQEMQDLYTRAEINSLRLHPYLLDTTLERDLLEAAGEDRTQEIYLELAWYGFLCGTKMEARMLLEDAACYLSPQLMFPFYSSGAILAEFGWCYQQFLAGTPYLAELYMYVSLLGYVIGGALFFLCGLFHRFQGLAGQLRKVCPVLILWFGLSLLYMMRGAAVFNDKYAAFQAVIGYLPFFVVKMSPFAGGSDESPKSEIMGFQR